MGTEGPHAAAHHSPLLAGIVVGDFKSKARDEVPQESKLTISGRPASSELIFQRRRFQEIDVTHRLRTSIRNTISGCRCNATAVLRKCRSPISFTCRILTIQACGICIAIQT
jgi:hypothetical protein